jgi:hypothetical protein
VEKYQGYGFERPGGLWRKGRSQPFLGSLFEESAGLRSRELKVIDILSFTSEGSVMIFFGDKIELAEQK